MKVKIKKNDFLDILILYWMMIYVFVISWLAYINQGAIVLIMLITIRFLVDFKRTHKFSPIYLGFLFCIAYPFWSYWAKGGSLINLNANIKAILTPVVVLTYCAYICKYKKNFICEFLIENKKIFNGYMILNIPILILQLAGNTSLSGRHPEELTNTFDADLVSGLFGYNGTGLLTMYVCFLVIYNYILFKTKLIKQKQLFIVYNLFLMGFIAFVAANSDNKALFILFPICLVVYLIVFRTSLNKNIIKKLKTIVNSLFKVLIAFSILLFMLQPFIGAIDLIHDTLINVQVGWQRLDSAYGSSERLGMIAYALSKSEMRWSGAGIARYAWQESYALNFAHFGISDFGVFLCLGGIFFVLLLILFLWSIYRSVFYDKIVASIFMIATAVVLIYTQLFTVTSLMCSWTFFVMITYIGSNSCINNEVMLLNGLRREK